MRFIALAAILMSLPLLVAWLRQRPRDRKMAIGAIAAIFFFGGFIQTSAALITWPIWAGPVRGIQINLADMLACALIITRKPGRIRTPLLWPIILYLATLLLSVLQSRVPMATVFTCVQFLQFILMYLALAPELGRRDSQVGLLSGLSIGLIVQGVSVFLEKAQGVVQAGGTGYHQNMLGIMTELAVLPIMAAILNGERRWLFNAGVLAGLVIVAGGGSRATMMFMAAGLATLLILSIIQYPTDRKFKTLGLTVLAAMVIVPFALTTLHARFGSEIVVAEDEQRNAMARSARAMASDHPFGVGANLYVTAGNLEGYSQRAGVTWGGGTRAAPVHNSYLLARAETGWIGEAAFILLFVVPMIAGFRHAFRFRRSADGSAALASAIALLVVSLHLNLEYLGHTYTVLGLTVLNIALVAGVIRNRRLPRPAVRPRPVRQEFPNGPVIAGTS